MLPTAPAAADTNMRSPSLSSASFKPTQAVRPGHAERAQVDGERSHGRVDGADLTGRGDEAVTPPQHRLHDVARMEVRRA